jgi:hypothetical protein
VLLGEDRRDAGGGHGSTPSVGAGTLAMVPASVTNAPTTMSVTVTTRSLATAAQTAARTSTSPAATATIAPTNSRVMVGFDFGCWRLMTATPRSR